MRKIIYIQPLPQGGDTCKLVALATIDNYYANMLGYEPIRTHKQGGLYPISMRQIGKSNGSIQGEVLEIRQLQKTLTDIGFCSEIVDFCSNPLLFEQKIMEALMAGDIPVTFFALDPATALPTPSFKGYNEHAAVISGFDDQQKVVKIIHWEGNHLTILDDLFKSAMVLPETREVEYYEPAVYPNGEKNKVKKYLLIRDTSQKDLTAPFIKHSITPEENSGFKAKLLIVKKPELINIQSSRALLLSKLDIKPTVDRFTFLRPPTDSVSTDDAILLSEAIDLCSLT